MIIDLERAKTQLQLYNSDNDDRVRDILTGAIQAVFKYMKSDASTRYFDESIGVYDVPEDIGAAILMCCENMFNDSTADPLTTAVRSLLERDRDPAIA